MATWRIIVQKEWFNLAGSIAISSFKEILSNLRKFYFSFKETCEIESESPATDRHFINSVVKSLAFLHEIIYQNLYFPKVCLHIFYTLNVMI